MLVEVSSNSTENDGVLTAAEESYVDNKVHTQKSQEENCEEGNRSEVCNYLTGGGDSTESDDSCVDSMMTNSKYLSQNGSSGINCVEILLI